MKTVWRCAALAVMAGALSACYYEPAYVRSGGGAYIGESAPVYSDPYPAYPAYYPGYDDYYYGGGFGVAQVVNHLACAIYLDCLR